MKIIAPIREAAQYEPLIENGAEELYGGVLDEQWNEKYGSWVEFNRRGNFSAQGNFRSYQELRQVIQKAAEDQIPFFLTMNAIGLTASQIPYLRDILRKYVDCGGHRVIVGNWLMLQLALEEDCEPTISSCAGIYNLETARFWEKAGAKRLILPRSISLSALRECMYGCGAHLEWEVFMMNSGCKFSDSMCRSLHNTSAGALCSFLDQRRKSYLDPAGNEITGRAVTEMKSDSFYYRQLYTGNCSIGCGQCAIWELLQLQTDSVKIVGRLMPTEQLIRCIKLTAQNISIAARSACKDQYLQEMTLPAVFLGQDICRNHSNCYYREINHPK